MKKYPKLSANDKIVMELVWQQGVATTSSILEILGDQSNWTRHTVKTYLLRLVDKGLLEKIQISPRKIKFKPIITKDEYHVGDASQYLSNHFKGLTHMVASFVDNEMISDKELNDLEQYIKNLKDKK